MSARQPAYARALRDLLRHGEPLHGIGVWLDQRPPDHPLLAPLACFSDTDPAACDWSLCAGRDVHIPDAHLPDPQRLTALVEAVRAVGPRRLIAWHGYTIDDGYLTYRADIIVAGGTACP